MDSTFFIFETKFFVYFCNKNVMYINETKIRVRYAETDQMGFVYYGNYPQYYEVARVEAMRNLGMSYQEMEEEGVMMPVIDMNIKYHKPAKYDQELILRCIIRELPVTRMKFEYEILNMNGELLNSGDTTLVFINKSTYRPCKCPSKFYKLLTQIDL